MRKYSRWPSDNGLTLFYNPIMGAPRAGAFFWISSSQCRASAAANSMLIVSQSRRSIVSTGSLQLEPRVSSIVSTSC